MVVLWPARVVRWRRVRDRLIVGLIVGLVRHSGQVRTVFECWQRVCFVGGLD